MHILSGGEQQRVRIAQALATDPRLLLCDEPLLSLDLNHQRAVVGLIDARRHSHGTAVLFVTHEINPVLPYVDRVLYLADGRFRIGSVDEVMTSASLSALYGSHGRGVPQWRAHHRRRHAGRAGRRSGAEHMSILADASGPSVWKQIFDFTDYGQLLDLVHNSLIAGLVLGVVGGLISVFVMMRDLPFAVHGISELSFAGAAGALLLGVNVVVGSLAGSLIAAVAIGALGIRARDRNSIIGVLMPFGLGLGVLFLSLYKGRAANKFGLLTGQIVAIDTPQLSWLHRDLGHRPGRAVRAVAPTDLRQPRRRCRRRARGAGAAALAGVHDRARVDGRHVGPDRRRPAGAEHRLHAGSGGDAGDGSSSADGGAQRGVRHGVDRRRDPAGAREQPCRSARTSRPSRSPAT